MKHILSEVTERIRERSAPTRYAYLQRIEKMSQRNRGADRMAVSYTHLTLPTTSRV